jgi:hypothetical protein
VSNPEMFEQEESEDEAQELEPLSDLEDDMDINNEDEIEPLATPPARDIVPLMDDDDLDREVVSLKKRGRVDIAREELREAVRKVKGNEKAEASYERPREDLGTLVLLMVVT